MYKRQGLDSVRLNKEGVSPISEALKNIASLDDKAAFASLVAQMHKEGSVSYTHLHYILGYISIIIGAVSWWFTITFFINKVRTRFNLRSLWLINRCIGGVIIIMSLVGCFMGMSGYFNH